MFTNLIFLLIVMLLASFSGVQASSGAFLTALSFFIPLLCLIAAQAWFLVKYLSINRDRVLFLVNLELTGYLVFVYLFVGLPQISYFQTLFSLGLALASIIAGQYVFHLFACHADNYSRTRYALKQTLLLLPFTFPILLYTLINDSINLAGYSIENLSTPSILVLGLAFTFLLLLFLPPILVILWNCQPIVNSRLLSKLNAICEKTEFKHRGIKTWTVLDHVPTAAIIGIIPRCRYILLTKTLINSSSDQALEAILAHEIGHSAHWHLIKLPLVLLGMAVGTTLILSFFETGISQYFAIANWTNPSQYTQSLALFAIFLPIALFVAFYIRFVFGYFSRLFERQADLYASSAGLPLDYMIEALDAVAVASGNTHDAPSWHHYSIRQRIAFLQKAQSTPISIPRHHAKTAISLIVYFIFLAIGILTLIAPEFPNAPLLDKINAYGLKIENSITKIITNPLIHTASELYTAKRGMEQYSASLQPALSKALLIQGVFNKPENLDHAVLSYLLYYNEPITAAALTYRIIVQSGPNSVSPAMLDKIIKELPDTPTGDYWKNKLSQT